MQAHRPSADAIHDNAKDDASRASANKVHDNAKNDANRASANAVGDNAKYDANAKPRCEPSKLELVFYMKSGDGKNSYAHNSSVQEQVIRKAKPVIENTIKSFFKNQTSPKCFAVADLGCSTGTRSLLPSSQIIDSMVNVCRQMGKQLPEVQVFLNDLPGNDFNSIFTSLPGFYEKIKEKTGRPCFVSGMPGSFYERLFPKGSLHLVHSSNSLHWLCQVPEGIENKGNIYVAKSSPKTVFEAYLKQFQKGFSDFLSSRAEELVSGGRMVLTFEGRTTPDLTDYDCCILCELLAKSVAEIVREGRIKKTDLDTFNLPLFNASSEEVRQVVQKEGSFCIDQLTIVEEHRIRDDEGQSKGHVAGENNRGEKLANHVRAVLESMLANHFGDAIIDDLFKRFSKIAGEHLSRGNNITYTNLVISLKRK